MASRDEQPIFANVNPHFFTVVLHNTLTHNQLLLPRKFVRQHGKTLSNHVLLKLPCGSEWKMDLEKSDDKVWLKKGWQEFSKNYSIGFGHFLVFRYQGNSRFDTFIFDKTTVEIDYPIVPSHSREPSDDDNEYDDDNDDSIVILEKFPTRPRKKSRTDTIIDENKRNFYRNTRARTSVNKTNPTMGIERSETESDSSVNVDHDTDFVLSDGQNTKRKIQGRNGSRAFEKHLKFGSENPFFRKTITSHNMRSTCQSVPVEFGRTYLKKTKQCVRLVLGRKSWSVYISYYTSHRDLYVFTGGWSRFVRDNCLSPGDVCVYELIRNSPAVFKVSIFRFCG